MAKKNIPFLIFLAPFLFLKCGSEPSTEQTETQSDMSTVQSSFSGRPVVFYNVENLFDTKNDPSKDDDDFTPSGYKQWDNERYQEKLERLGEVMGLFNATPILVGLAEIENRAVLEDLTTRGGLKNNDFGIEHFESPDRRGIDCALLYDKDAFTVINSTKISVKLDYNRHFATRDILYVEGEMEGGVIAHVFVNHWSSRREGKDKTEHKRMEAAETLREKVDEILGDNPDANIIILGDFNDHPDDKSLEFVLRAKESGYEGDGDLVNLLYEDHMDGDGTSVHNREWAVLDQIIVSQAIYDQRSGLGIKGQDASILDNNKLIYTYPDGGQKPNSSYGGRKYFGGYSDHLPVYIVLK